MALTATTLAAACTANDQTIKVTSATGATVGGFVKVDAEWMKVLAINGTTISVQRLGANGGAVVEHKILAVTVFGLSTDTAAYGVYESIPVPGTDFDQVNIGANGVIAVPKKPTRYFINKGSALATSTFADPAADQDGLIVSFTNGTDFAAVVTTVSVHDGTTGAHTTLTSPAFAGGTLTLMAKQAKWYVVSNNLWVIT